MLCDYERAWLEFRRHLTTKSGHGTFGPEGLLAKMAELEIECAVLEGPTERTLRLFGIEVSQDLLKSPGEPTPGPDPAERDTSIGIAADPKGDVSNARSRKAA